MAAAGGSAYPAAKLGEFVKRNEGANIYEPTRHPHRVILLEQSLHPPLERRALIALAGKPITV